MYNYENRLKEKYAGSAGMDAQELEKAIANLEAKELKKTKPLPYRKIKSKVWKGKLAPQGKLFIGVQVKKPKVTYTNVMLLDCEGKQDHLEELLYVNMYLLLNEKYKFDKDVSDVEVYKQEVEAKANQFTE